ncbi:MAG TPA: hypothetical protein VGN07_15950 [Steroidobacteraceae bacterium]|jgi:hypothetical protein
MKVLMETPIFSNAYCPWWEAQYDALRVGDSICVAIAYQHDVAGSSLGHVDATVGGERKYPRIVQPFGKPLHVEPFWHLQRGYACIGRRQALRLIDVALDSHVGQFAVLRHHRDRTSQQSCDSKNITGINAHGIHSVDRPRISGKPPRYSEVPTFISPVDRRALASSSATTSHAMAS